MSEHLVSKTINLCVVKLSKTHSIRFAHGASLSWAIACVPRLDLDCFELQSDTPRLNQGLPSIVKRRYRRII